MPPFLHRHFERKREIFFVRGQAKIVREAGNGKHRMLHVTGDHGASCRWIYEGKQQTANEKDPSAALGMTKRGNASRPFLFNPEQKPISAPSGHLLPEEGGRSGENYLLPSRGRGMPEGQGVGRRKMRAKPTSIAAPPPSKGRRENAAFPASSFRAEARNLFRSRSGKNCEGSGERETPYASCDWGSRCFMQMDLRRKTANGKRKRSLGCARDDETRKRFPPIPFQSRAEANLCPFGAPPSRGRRKKW